jgi:hypothetical protein
MCHDCNPEPLVPKFGPTVEEVIGYPEPQPLSDKSRGDCLIDQISRI